MGFKGFTAAEHIEVNLCSLFPLPHIPFSYSILLPLSPSSLSSSPSSLQRSGTRRRYHDDGISDDEIEGKRTFDLEEKLRSERFTSDRVKRMEGKGQCWGVIVILYLCPSTVEGLAVAKYWRHWLRLKLHPIPNIMHVF